MCLTVSEDKQDVQIADKMLFCFKVGEPRMPFLERFKSFFNSFSYKRFEVQDNVDIYIKENSKGKIVNEGYHSYNKPFISFAFQMFIIPKGARYYEGFTNNKKNEPSRTSSSIVWIGNIFNPITWFILLFISIGIVKFEVKKVLETV